MVLMLMKGTIPPLFVEGRDTRDYQLAYPWKEGTEKSNYGPHSEIPGLGLDYMASRKMGQ